MDFQFNFGHYGDVVFSVSGSPGGHDIPLVVLRKAPLKYYDPERDKDDKEDKTKADVVFGFIGDEWHQIGWTDHYPDAILVDEIEDMLSDKLNSL